jgi:hypothetical protein
MLQRPPPLLSSFVMAASRHRKCVVCGVVSVVTAMPPPHPHIHSDSSASSEIPLGISGYLRCIDASRKAVAVAAGISALALIVSARQQDYVFYVLKQESGVWAAVGWISCVCFLACGAATFLLVVEAVARLGERVPPSARTLSPKLLSLSLLLASVWTFGVVSYGVPQAIGAVMAALLLVAAVRTRGPSRVLFVCLAVALVGLTIRLTNHAYHYARWNADEIVAAGRTLMDTSTLGVTLEPSGQSLPSSLRRLGVQRILVDPDRVVIYHAGVQPAEFQIYAQPTRDIERVWIQRTGKKDGGIVKINDRLWMIVDN